ncbi:hypothetical protein BH20ACT2_BH20ACT2_04180 [soil metagenome]
MPADGANMAEYTIAAVVATAGVVVLELRFWRTGLFRLGAYWLTMAISLAFMIGVNGWLTKLSAPIVTYDDDRRLLPRFPWDIPMEDYLFGYALLTLVLLCWWRQGGGPEPLPPEPPSVERSRLRRRSGSSAAEPPAGHGGGKPPAPPVA